MHALQVWNGGVILISHDERFITKVASEVSPRLVREQKKIHPLIQLFVFPAAVGVWGGYGEEILWGCEGVQAAYRR